MSIVLGNTAKDVITGFEGIVTGYAVFHNNCDRLGLQPRELDKDGKPRERCWFDVTQLELVSNEVVGYVAPVKHSFKMLDEVVDPITGHKGIITSFTTWLSGCVRAGVQDKGAKDGKPYEDFTVPVQQLELVKASPPPKKEKTGGPMRNPSEVRDPR